MSKVTLWQGDNMPWLRSLPSESVDLIITSPPFNLGREFHSRGGKLKDHELTWGAYGDFDDNLPEEVYQKQQTAVLAECFRLLKPNGSMYYHHKVRIREGRSITPWEWLLETAWVVKQEITIDQRRTANTDPVRYYPTASERLYWMTKHPKVKLLDRQCAKHTNLWVIPTNASRAKTGHPAAFNIELPRRCIVASSRPEDMVLDPYMGVATTGMAALELGRSFMGAELDQRYYERAERNMGVRAAAAPEEVQARLAI